MATFFRRIKAKRTEQPAWKARASVVDAVADELEQLRGEVRRANVDRAAFLAMTEQLDDHPEGYDGPCHCHCCRSYGAQDGEGSS
jgi:hypothetical protein